MTIEELIIRALQGHATPEELAQIERWRSLAGENERRYQAMAELWTLTGAGEPGSSGTPVPDAESLIRRAEAESAEAERRATRRSSNRWVTGVRKGMLAAGLAAAGFVLAFMAEDLGLVPQPLGASIITTGPDEIATVALADGSSVRLGPESRLRFIGQKRDRTIWLDGRAFFGVEGESGRRFVVRTPGGEVVVHGTRFEVRSESDEFRVMVVEGKVSVSTKDGRVDLDQSEMGRVADGQPPRKIRIADPYGQLGWMGNHLVFRATPLGQAVEEIRRHFGVAVTLDQPLERVPITATFTDRSPEDVVLVLCEIVGATCELHPESRRFGIGVVASGPVSARGA